MTNSQYDHIHRHIAQLDRMVTLFDAELCTLRDLAENIAIADHAHPQADLFTPAELTLRIPDRIRALIDRVARAEGIDPAQVILDAINNSLDLPPEPHP
jgi:hypothetical protein